MAQFHTHEFAGSVRLPEQDVPRHTHRFAGVTGEAILIGGGNHVHRYVGRTDFYSVPHFHMIEGVTSPAVFVGGGRHVHFAENTTTIDFLHDHAYIFSTLIDNPAGD